MQSQERVKAVLTLLEIAGYPTNFETTQFRDFGVTPRSR